MTHLPVDGGVEQDADPDGASVGGVQPLMDEDRGQCRHQEHESRVHQALPRVRVLAAHEADQQPTGGMAVKVIRLFVLGLL